MTSEEERISKLEDKYHNVDKRQESFETFMRAYIEGNEKRLDRIENKMDKLESKLDNLLIAGGIGLATILATMVGMFSSLKP